MAGSPGKPRQPVQTRDIRKFRILGYSSLVFAVVVAILMLSTGNIGFGIGVLVIALLLGFSLWWTERMLKREAEAEAG